MDNRVKTCEELTELQRMLREESYSLFLCDVKLRQKFLREVDIVKVAVDCGIPVAVTANYASMPLADDAIAVGAFTTLLKPFREADVLAALEHAASVIAAETPHESGPLPPTPPPEMHFGCLIGEHPCMLKLYSQIERMAVSDMTVLIRGESGTGKELVAKALHNCSPRAGKPFVAVNCASLNDQLLESELFGYVKGAFTGAFKNKQGLFQAANGGTLFLDEIGSVSINMQQTLLRVLEDKRIRPVGGTDSITVDTRVIAATNENMEQRMQNGDFRLDLYHRLSVLPIFLPPLRERREDIPILADAFLAHAKPGAKLSTDAVKLLTAAPWPGNVRQLENAISRAAALLKDDQNIIGVDSFPGELALEPEPTPRRVGEDSLFPGTDDTLTLKAYLRVCERHYLHVVLDSHNGDKEAAARSLGISLATFYRKFEEA